jgi:hypothetical protein
VQIVFMLIGALRSMTKTTTAMSLCSVACSCGKTASRLMQPPCRKGPNSRCAIDTSHHRELSRPRGAESHRPETDNTP